jgi:hypothetical protein
VRFLPFVVMPLSDLRELEGTVAALIEENERLRHRSVVLGDLPPKLRLNDLPVIARAFGFDGVSFEVTKIEGTDAPEA